MFFFFGSFFINVIFYYILCSNRLQNLKKTKTYVINQQSFCKKRIGLKFLKTAHESTFAFSIATPKTKKTLQLLTVLHWLHRYPMFKWREILAWRFVDFHTMQRQILVYNKTFTYVMFFLYSAAPMWRFHCYFMRIETFLDAIESTESILIKEMKH
jgi:hypothetical protein